MHTHMNIYNSLLDRVLFHWTHFAVLRFIFMYVNNILVSLLHVARTTTSFSALTLFVGSFDP